MGVGSSVAKQEISHRGAVRNLPQYVLCSRLAVSQNTGIPLCEMFHPAHSTLGCHNDRGTN